MTGSNEDRSATKQMWARIAKLTDPGNLARTMQILDPTSHLSSVQYAHVYHSNHFENTLPATAKFLARLEQLTNPPHLYSSNFAESPIWERLASAVDRAHVGSAHAQASILDFSRYYDRVTSIVESNSASSKLSDFVSTYHSFVDESVLASFLVRPGNGAKPPTQTVQVEGFDSLAVGDWADLEVVDLADVDKEIVEAIKKDQVAGLSSTAIRRLQFVYASIIWFWDMFIRISDTRAAMLGVVLLVQNCSLPVELRAQVDKLPAEQKALLADIRLVNTAGAKLRAEPSTKSRIIASLPFAQQVEVIEYNDNGWYLVEVETEDGYQEGWMYVSVTTPVVKPKRDRGQNADTDTL